MYALFFFPYFNTGGECKFGCGNGQGSIRLDKSGMMMTFPLLYVLTFLFIKLVMIWMIYIGTGNGQGFIRMDISGMRTILLFCISALLFFKLVIIWNCATRSLLT